MTITDRVDKLSKIMTYFAFIVRGKRTDSLMLIERVIVIYVLMLSGKKLYCISLVKNSRRREDCI